MLDIGWSELLLCAIVALVVIGPKDLPRAMRTAGRFVGRARGMARHFRTGFDAMVREAELEEMEKAWARENERIMREHPPEVMAPLPEPTPKRDDEAPAPPTSEPELPLGDRTSGEGGA